MKGLTTLKYLFLSDTVLKRGFANLIANAVNHGGGAEVTIGGDGPDRVVTIDDQGPGIAADELERVFTPFYRLERARGRDKGGTGGGPGGGTGLGLALARAAFRGHGGDVQLENRTGGGLRATVTLPG